MFLKPSLLKKEPNGSHVFFHPFALKTILWNSSVLEAYPLAKWLMGTSSVMTEIAVLTARVCMCCLGCRGCRGCRDFMDCMDSLDCTDSLDIMDCRDSMDCTQS